MAERKKVTDFARAANMRQGYVRDPALEAANDRFVAGEITLDELRDEMLETARRLS